MPVKSIGGSRYFITFTDDFSRNVTVLCISSKEEVKSCVKSYIARIEREKDRKVKRFRTDNGLEFCNKELSEYFRSAGIKHEKSNVETPQMNGVAERINRTLLDLTRSMLKSAHLLPKFWAEAVTTAAYIKNRVCHSTIRDQIPFTVWTEKIPSVRHLKAFKSFMAALPMHDYQTKGERNWTIKQQNVYSSATPRKREDIDYGAHRREMSS